MEKFQIIRKYKEKKVSLQSLAQIYQVSKSLIYTVIKDYERNGVSTLSKEIISKQSAPDFESLQEVVRNFTDLSRSEYSLDSLLSWLRNSRDIK